MALHVFLDKKVDATILEVGVGGTYDSTNIVPNPVVTGITTLGIDHIHVLGKTIQDIAWQKSGIFKVHSCADFAISLKQLAGKCSCLHFHPARGSDAST